MTTCPQEILAALQNGTVIPAHPLALTENRKLDEKRQRALTRYYLHAGVGGMAVAVHTTQFEIREPQFKLFQPVLELAGEEIDDFSVLTKKPIVKIAGIVGQTKQAVAEAQLVADLGYHAALLSLAAFKHASNEELLEHCRQVAQVIPVVGFYLQPSVGGRRLDFDFWRQFAEIENVIAIKIAPFNRYQSLDVIRGVAESGRSKEIALYTGNDDNIIPDLVTDYEVQVGDQSVKMEIVGGLLGHWAVWTKRVVELFQQVKKMKAAGQTIPKELLTLGGKITDCNAAFFDVAHNFAGVITGIHEVLRRQGLLQGIWTLNPNETLSPGQKEEIDRVYAAYPELNDDAFIQEHLHKWLT